MPTVEELVVTTNELKTSDVIVVGKAPKGAVVGHANVSSKSTNVGFRDGTHVRATNVSKWTVTRTTYSQEERDAEWAKTVKDQLRKNLLRYLSDHPSNRLREIAEVRQHYIEQLDWSNLGGVLKAQALRKQALNITSALPEAIRETPGLASDDEIVDAYAKWYLYDVQRFSQFNSMRVNDPTSRSTSVISNILEDLDEWAKASIVRDMLNYGDMVEVRAEEIKRERDVK